MDCIHDSDAVTPDDKLRSSGVDYCNEQSERSQEDLFLASEDWMIAGSKLGSCVLRMNIKNSSCAIRLEDFLVSGYWLTDLFSTIPIQLEVEFGLICA